jgi:hypothetical protein
MIKRIVELLPGDEANMAGQKAVVVSVTTPHPKYGGFTMVVWLFPEGHPLGLRGSVDALSPWMEVTDVKVQTDMQRFETLCKAVQGEEGT